ncbi:MAG: hypothetical protein EA427_05720 [Spirochaetaceae bacterium]|nr:MAG: hypothetical protein EA427_05720 [Spirochaetaceae bacterium]
MKIWDELNDNLKDSTRTWMEWARRHAQELGDAGLRHVERQDLLSERRRSVALLGEVVANRFILEDKKMVRADSPGVAEIIERLRKIESRLEHLRGEDSREDQEESE